LEEKIDDQAFLLKTVFLTTNSMRVIAAALSLISGNAIQLNH
jgi:hypothetical protein